MSLHQDVLAEIELTMVPSLRLRPEGSLYVPDGIAEAEGARRRFWCSVKKQEVEVEFETGRRFGIPRLRGIRRCSAFDEPHDVACGRHCLDSAFRRRWPFALPVFDRRQRPLG